MTPLTFAIKQQKNRPTKRQIDAKSNWIVVFPEKLTTAQQKGFPYATELLAQRKKLGAKGTDKEPHSLDLGNSKRNHVVYVCIDAEMSVFSRLTLARKLIAAHGRYKTSTIGVAIHGFNEEESENIAEAIVAAGATTAAGMPSYKSTKPKAPALKRLELFGVRASHGFKRSIAEAEGNGVSRYLSMMPPNKLTPTTYLKEIRQLAKYYGWKLEFMDERTLKQKKAGAFLAVTQGSPTPDAGIVRLEYKTKATRSRGKLALVGKGLCYDTGGTNLKPARSMFGMHEDMQGSAVALGTLIALTKLKVNFNIECWLALAMNHIGPKAYKPNDIITAIDGTTIEIVHTDAEGRMVLADTLAMASKKKPKLIMDYATLTGACVYSLGTSYSGVFTNKEAFNPTLIEAGKDSGERVWPFPMDEDFDKLIDSDIADVKQCSLEGGSDHILAARFLQRFVKNDTPWVHVDLSASNVKGGLAHVPTDTTGFGVRFSLNLLLDKKLI